MKNSIVKLALLFASILPISLVAQVDYEPVSPEALREVVGGSPIDFKILVDAENLGGEETRIAELTFHPNYDPRPHTHDAIEIFYVISGRFGHNVNGVPAILEPGQIGICRPGNGY